jgi:hypothetical protein
MVASQLILSEILFVTPYRDMKMEHPGILSPMKFFFADENFQFEVVPEPSVLSLAAAGLLGIVYRHRRRVTTKSNRPQKGSTKPAIRASSGKLNFKRAYAFSLWHRKLQ